MLLAQSKFKDSQYQVSFDACRIALHNLGVGNYQSKLRMELRYLAGETLIRLVRMDEARKYFESLVSEDSKFLTSGLAHLSKLFSDLLSREFVWLVSKKIVLTGLWLFHI